jgi:hypothetical protein
MILALESGAQEDQFDEKNGGKKSRDTIPLKGEGWGISCYSRIQSRGD